MTTPESNEPPATPGPEEGIPRHVAVIMDGNGRWATSRGQSRIYGHRKGAESVREIIRACAERHVACLTLFAFSSENWRRPQREVRLLMELFISVLEKDIDSLVKNGIRLKIIGDLERFGTRINKLIKKAEMRTADNQRMQLLIAANYGGQWDIAQASRKLAARVAIGEMLPEDIDEQMLASQLVTHEFPDPDLFIRTGGEKRISNFLIWQLAYTELYFTDVLWPDFRAADLDAAIEWYAGRERRYGQTSEQLARADHA